jgi:GNAT superfamily N-acetyltransferase
MDTGQIVSIIFRTEHWTSPLTLAGLVLLSVVVITAVPKPARRSEGIGRILRRDIVIMTLLPMLSLALLLTDRSIRYLSEGTVASVEAAVAGLSAIFEERLENAQDAVNVLALNLGAVRDAEDTALKSLLLRFHEIHPEFISTLAADAEGQVIAATIATGDGIVARDARDVRVADRDYFREPMRTGQRYLSPAFRGRGLGSDVIVAASAPVTGHDGPGPAVLEGSIDFVRLGEVARNYPLPESAEFVVLDPSGQVAASNRPLTFRPLSVPGDGLLSQTDEDAYISARGDISDGWEVIVRLPVARLHELVMADLVVSAVWLAISLSLALVLAAVLTARVSQPLQHLAEAVKEYVPPASTDRIAVTSRAPQEVRILARHFNLSARRMNELYGRLVAMLAERDSGDANGKSPDK